MRRLIVEVGQGQWQETNTVLLRAGHDANLNGGRTVPVPSGARVVISGTISSWEMYIYPFHIHSIRNEKRKVTLALFIIPGYCDKRLVVVHVYLP